MLWNDFSLKFSLKFCALKWFQSEILCSEMKSVWNFVLWNEIRLKICALKWLQPEILCSEMTSVWNFVFWNEFSLKFWALKFCALNWNFLSLGLRRGRIYTKCLVEYIDRAHMYGYNLQMYVFTPGCLFFVCFYVYMFLYANKEFIIIIIIIYILYIYIDIYIYIYAYIYEYIHNEEYRALCCLYNLLTIWPMVCVLFLFCYMLMTWSCFEPSVVSMIDLSCSLL